MNSRVPNLLLVDIMLPGISGLEIIKKTKATSSWKNIPIIVISAKGSEIDKVVGLDIGADDYLAKPFGVLELISRVKALLRRSTKTNRDTTQFIGEIELVPEERKIVFKNKSVKFTEKEYLLLELLLTNAGRTVSRDEMIKTIWGYDFLGESRTIDVHIKGIRSKLILIDYFSDPIQTIRGTGYKFNL
jgi:two-component system alkaline phosphatase synthesis response regulator PhoP